MSELSGMKPISLLLICLISHSRLIAQCQHHMDSTFLQSTAFAHQNHWVLSGGSLRSQAPTGINMIQWYAPCPIGIENVMIANLNPRLATSSNNYVWWGIFEHSRPDTGLWSGYAVKLGGTEDEVSLYKFEAGKSTLLIDGQNGRLSSSSNNQIEVKLISKPGFRWELYTRYREEMNFKLEGFIVDSSFRQFNSTGMRFHFSSSNANNLWVKNISSFPYVADTISPQITEAYFEKPNQIRIRFSEVLDTIIKPTVYINSGKFKLHEVNWETSSSIRLLTHDTVATHRQRVVLSLGNFQDLYGNLTDNQWIEVVLRRPRSGDIRINEILADPTPSRGLPEFEFVELYNTTPDTLDLHHLFYEDNGTLHALGNGQFLPFEKLVITNMAGCSAYTVLAKTICLALPSSFLSNSGETIRIRTDDELIDEVSYRDADYTSALGKDGGISLELINPYDSCAALRQNWVEALMPMAGSPGTQNTRYDSRPDSLAPRLKMAFALDSQSLCLVFDELLSPIGFGIGGLYSEPSVSFSSFEFRGDTLFLFLSTALKPNPDFKYRIWGDGPQDCSGNKQTMDFQCTYAVPRTAKKHDVFISEMLFQAADSLGAWVKLCNRSQDAITTEKLSLQQNNRNWPIPATQLMPNQCMLMVNKELKTWKSMVDLPVFDGLGALLSLAGEVELLTENSEIIDLVAYSRSDYSNKLHELGGYSLIRNDTAALCSWPSKWVSMEPRFAIPRPNHHHTEAKPDIKKPHLLRAWQSHERELILHFDSPLEKISLSNVWINGLDLLASEAFAVDKWQKKWALKLHQELSANIHQLEVKNLAFCGGKTIQIEKVYFSLIDTGTSLVFSELLFNPRDGGEEFIEFYHTGNKAINLNQFLLARKSSNGEWEIPRAITTDTFPVYPGEYMVVAANSYSLINQYASARSGLIAESKTLPTLPNSGASLGLFSSDLRLIESVTYTEKQHHKALIDVKGFSLERLSIIEPATDEKNWHSAAVNVGGATPCAENSRRQWDSRADQWKLENEVFSPDGDGYQDLLIIHFKQEDVELNYNLRILDLAGNEVYAICRSCWLSETGQLYWDGSLSSGGLAAPGVYILELLAWQETSIAFKKRFAVVLAQGRQ